MQCVAASSCHVVTSACKDVRTQIDHRYLLVDDDVVMNALTALWSTGKMGFLSTVWTPQIWR